MEVYIVNDAAAKSKWFGQWKNYKFSSLSKIMINLEKWYYIYGITYAYKA